ncbi:MAG: hypothetical protein FIA95_09445, partial [Gemmatimonadetes bacterium]|nr:hypothetical protein [Gemmatimonadota bacterium]
MRRRGLPGLAGLVLALALLVPAPVPAAAHDRFTDPVLAELNDYLVAIQVLRLGDAHAAALFARWQAVREASWKIRDMTEKDGLSIHDPAVERQIAVARELRLRLRDDCRSYLASLEGKVPTAHFRVGTDVRVTWPDTVLETRVGAREVILIEVSNAGAAVAHVEMARRSGATRGDDAGADRILFWDKS